MPVATQDPEFIKASPEDQHAYLAQTDPDYAKASPDEQQAYLGHLTGRGNIGTPPPAAGPHVQMGENYQSVPAERTPEGHQSAIERREKQEGVLGQFGMGFAKAGGMIPFAESVPRMISGDEERPDLSARGPYQIAGKIAGTAAMIAPSMVSAPMLTLRALGGGALGNILGSQGAKALGASQNTQDVAGDIGGVAGGIAGTKTPTISGLRKWGMGDPNAATSKALHVTPHSPEMQSTLGEVEGARPYLKGATSQADVQGKLPGAKAEVWEPYNKAVALVKDRIVKGPDGPMTVGDLEAERLKLSAEMQIAQKARPTDTQTAIQAEKQIADMKERYKAITGALDPALESTGIDPAVIRKTHGQLKGIERNVSGKSTVTEPMQPYGLRKMVPSRVPNPLGSEWKWEPIQGAKDIAAGRPLWKGHPTDVAMKDLFSRGGAKPNLGTPRMPRIAGMLLAAPTELPSSMEPLGEPSIPPTTQFGTRAERLGLMLPEGATPLKPYGYNEPGMKFPYPRPK